MSFTVGDVISGYTIEGELGAGGMGTVYQARNPVLPRSDALKVLSVEFSRDEQFQARFLREADVAATLDHPNIVAVYNRGEADGRLWIAMQYVAGTDADRELRAGTMTPSRAVHIIAEVAKALDFAHRRGILHRDVKPANFLLTPGDERVFLADFGIARALDDAGHLTTDGTVMTSIAYASPEALAGEHIDHRADVYSLGCALFRLLTRKSPYAGLSGGLAAVAAAHMTAPIPRPTALVASLPTGLDDVIAKAMAKDPDKRYQSAGELAGAARAALTATPARAPSAPSPHAATTQEWTTNRPPPAPPRAQGRPAEHSGWHSAPPVGGGTRPDAVTYPTGAFSGQHRPFTGPHEQTVPRPPTAPFAHVSDKRVKPSRTRRRVFAGLGLAVVVAVVATLGIVLTRQSRTPAYDAQTLTHAHGSTQLTTAPTAVAALGPGDADAVLSLGLQPVALLAAGGTVPSFVKDKLTTSAPVLSFIDTNAIAAAKPDVIIATGDVDDATYDRLKGIAPTITRPADTTKAWNWQTQLQWIGKIVGRADKATALITTSGARQTDLRNQNAAVVGKTVSVLNVTSAGLTQTLSPSNAADYLTSLGLSYSNKLQRQPTDAGSTRALADTTKLYLIDTDALIVVRTDATAGGGGAAGLPRELAAYRGAEVVVDDPNIVAALAEPGGYLATGYLDAHLVPQLAGDFK